MGEPPPRSAVPVHPRIEEPAGGVGPLRGSGHEPSPANPAVMVVVTMPTGGDTEGGVTHAPGPGEEQAPAQRRGEEPEQAPTFGWAWQPELVRSQQKDDYYQRMLLSSVTESLQAVAGPRAVGAHKNEAALAAGLLYEGVTTLAGQQTLGEEYCDIRQVDVHTDETPRRATRIALIAWRTLLPYLAQLAISRVQRVQSTMGSLGQRLGASGDEARANILARARSALIGALAAAILALSRSRDTLARLHTAWFFLRGRFHTLPHRLAGVRLASITARRVPGGVGDENPAPYAILGRLVAAQACVSPLCPPRVRVLCPRLDPQVVPWMGCLGV
jgi:hypothetical protein